MVKYGIYMLTTVNCRGKKTFNVVEKLLCTVDTLQEANEYIDKLSSQDINISDIVVYPRYVL